MSQSAKMAVPSVWPINGSMKLVNEKSSWKKLLFRCSDFHFIQFSLGILLKTSASHVLLLDLGPKSLYFWHFLASTTLKNKIFNCMKMHFLYSSVCLNMKLCWLNVQFDMNWILNKLEFVPIYGCIRIPCHHLKNKWKGGGFLNLESILILFQLNFLPFLFFFYWCFYISLFGLCLSFISLYK